MALIIAKGTVVIDVFRHANAKTAGEGQPDFTRPLSDKGRRQASIVRRWLKRPSYGLVLSSPALRAVQTAAIVGSRAQAGVIIIPALYWGSNDKLNTEMFVMFEKLGYATPLEYDLENGGHLIRKQNNLAWREIWQYISTGLARRVLIVGHAILAPGVGQAAAIKSNMEHFTKLNVSLDEATGYRMVVDKTKSTVLSVELLDLA